MYDLTPASLSSTQTAADVQALARALSPIASYCTGDEAALDASIEPSEASGLASGLTQLARALRAAIKEEGDAVPLSLIFDSSLSRAEIATLVAVCDRVAARATEVLPTGKKKKNKNGQLRKARLFELRDALRSVREIVPSSEEKTFTWQPSLGDEERREELGKSVADAQAELTKAVEGVLKK